MYTFGDFLKKCMQIFIFETPNTLIRYKIYGFLKDLYFFHSTVTDNSPTDNSSTDNSSTDNSSTNNSSTNNSSTDNSSTNNLSTG